VEEIEIDGTGTSESAKNKNRIAKIVNILIYHKLFKVILEVS